VTPLFGLNDCLNFWFVIVNKAIDVKNSIQVIELVLKDSGKPTFCLDSHGVLVKIDTG
jgi:hypothetical protein